eukprot:PRCOL_00004706-RA
MALAASATRVGAAAGRAPCGVTRRARARAGLLPPPNPSALGRAPVSAEDAAEAARATARIAEEAATGGGGGAFDAVLVDGGVTALQLVVGFVVGVFPFAWASVEFGKRILIQRRCEGCGGSGLVEIGSKGLRRKVRCRACGGFLPWESWEKFFLGTGTPGTGGPLLVPRGQTGRLTYKVPPRRDAAGGGGRAKEAAVGARASAEDSEA